MQACAEADRQSPRLVMRHRVLPALQQLSGGVPRMMRGDNMSEQISRHQPDDLRQANQGLFRAAGQDTEGRQPAARPITFGAAAQPSWAVFSNGSDYDVAEQQRPATQHDEVAMRSLRLPFEAEADVVDALDQRRSVPFDEDDYR